MVIVACPLTNIAAACNPFFMCPRKLSETILRLQQLKSCSLTPVSLSLRILHGPIRLNQEWKMVRFKPLESDAFRFISSDLCFWTFDIRATWVMKRVKLRYVTHNSPAIWSTSDKVKWNLSRHVFFGLVSRNDFTEWWANCITSSSSKITRSMRHEITRLKLLARESVRSCDWYGLIETASRNSSSDKIVWQRQPTERLHLPFFEMLVPAFAIWLKRRSYVSVKDLVRSLITRHMSSLEDRRQILSIWNTTQRNPWCQENPANHSANIHSLRSTD